MKLNHVSKAQAVFYALKLRGYTDEQLADILGVTRTTLIGYTNTPERLKVSDLDRLINELKK